MFAMRFLALTLLLAPCLTAAVSVTVASNPAGRVFTVSANCGGGTYSTPRALDWPSGGSCTVAFDSPQGVQNGTRFVFSGWQDGGNTNPRVIPTPAQPTTFTANFAVQFLITAVASPPAGGTVTGGDWYNAGTIAILTASPNAGYRLAGWVPSLPPAPGPASISVPAAFAQTVTANFAPAGPAPPGAYGFSRVASFSTGRGINNAGQVTGTSQSAAFLWTPLTANGTVGNLVDIGGLPIGGTANMSSGINSKGQIAGSTLVANGSGPQAFVWTPGSPNGSTGTATAILGNVPGTTLGINNYGQVAGSGPNGGFIWTPATPNGTIGTVNSDSRLSGLTAINNFGQAIANSVPQPLLFTPASANGTSGSFTPIPGLPGAVYTQAAAINQAGVVAGSSCIPAAAACVPHAFLWNPVAANATPGAVAEIPLPAGYSSMIPIAMNAGGQVVGILSLAGGATTPFLYTGGSVYDLGVLSTQFASAAAAAINDQGQILLNASDGVYLLTPGTAPPVPTAGTVAVTISSNFAGQAFSVSGAGCGAGGYNTPQTLYWTPSSSCTISFLSPQSTQIGSRYLFNAWQDGPVINPRVFTAPAQPATYTASFTQQFLITALASPPEGGTVSGGGWYTAGASVTLTATAAAGYRLLDWSPLLAAGSTASISVPAAAPQTFTANFILLSAIPPNNYLVTQIVLAANSGLARPLNNYGQVTGFASNGAFLWTPSSAGAPIGDLTDLGGLAIGSGVFNVATGMNDRGQVIGVTTVQGIPTIQPFLWSPATPNATTGSMTAFLGTGLPGVTLAGINSYGQIAGSLSGVSFVWTPASPNGSTGSLNNDGRLSGIVSINDFGQAITGQSSMLFTPSAAHGASGSFTPIPGLVGATSQQLVAIGNSGAIVGMSCIPLSPGDSCRFHGFLWTPSSLNGTVGNVSEIPLPAGFQSMSPTAINSIGQVVGSMLRSDGVITPFLYSGGNVYDLSTLSSQLRPGNPSGINDRGQITIDALAAIYLLTPNAAPPSPPAGSVGVTISANAPIAPFTVSGIGCSPGAYVSPQTLYWVPGSSCTVTMTSPHTATLGSRFVFTNWQDGANANPRVITAPAQTFTYVANFFIQFYVSTAANPAAGGTVSGSGWYPGGSTATLTATASTGYRFLDWTPEVGAPGAASATLTVNSPQTVVANFVALSSIPPTEYLITQVSSAPGSIPGTIRPLNNFGQVVLSSGPSIYLWTPAAANSSTGVLSPVTGLLGGSSLDLASAINDQGQIVGTSIPGNPADGKHFLWTPATSNGTTGTSVSFLGSTTGVIPGALDINSFGQISGSLSTSPFLWTPFLANGSAGAALTDSRLLGIRGINDFGQAIAVSSAIPTLFTPSSPHASGGTFTPVFGLPGASNTLAMDINNAGVIAGSSCIPTSGGQPFTCSSHAFLWNPTSPNGATGNAVEIPLPTGILAMFPLALNAGAQMVGSMNRTDGSSAPFLYTSGNVYDLSTLSSQFRAAVALGINDKGQIVINAAGVVYLLTPKPSILPAPIEVVPGAGSGFTQTMKFTFTDPRGAEDLDVVNILINSFLDGRNACYLAYSRPYNILFLVDDPGTALLPGVVLSGSGATANSQCTVSFAGAPVVSGNTLTLTFGITFSAGFAGNKTVYTAARDLAQNNSGWQALGTWAVPGPPTTPAAAVSSSPARGSGSSQTFTFTFSDTKGWQDLGVVNILINNFLDGRNACYLAYSRPYNALYLVNDNSTALAPGLSNTQCSVSSFSASGNGNTLTVTMTINFTPAFAGNRVIYLAARDNGDANTSGWQPLGSWTVQ